MFSHSKCKVVSSGTVKWLVCEHLLRQIQYGTQQDVLKT